MFAYYDSGAGDEQTLAANVAALKSLIVRPRYLVDVSSVSLSSRLLSLSVPAPLAIAPTAMQRMAHPDGEVATVRAAASLGLPMTLSTIAHTSLEDVRAAAPSASLFFQLYVYNDAALTADLIRRAKAARYHALVLTVDTPAIGLRDREVKAAFVGSPSHLPLANFSHPSLRGLASFPVGHIDPGSDPLQRSAAVTWDSAQRMAAMTDMALVLKGIMTREDAVEGCRRGAQGIVVSNHGGRQLDGVPATVEALSEVVRGVREWEEGEGKGRQRVAVMVDGGVRRGSDVFKLLALGADCVMVGRPVLWGLAYAGEEGVRQVLKLLKSELEVCMALAGCPTIASINRSRITTRAAMHPKL